MRRKRYQVVDRMEKKVWEVQVDGATLTTRFWPRKNLPARTSEREMESPEGAKKEMDRLCREREDQDYVLIQSEDTTPKAAKASAAMARLEEAIVAAPDSVEPYMVYGDWLSEQDDPLGRLIAVQIKRVEKPRDKALIDEEVLLLREHADVWLAELDGEEGFDASWRWGFLDEARFGLADSPCSMDPLAALDALFRLPTSRFLRGLVLGDFGAEEDFDYAPESDYSEILRAIGDLNIPPTLRRFGVEPKLVRLGSAYVGSLEPIYSRMPNLESLWVKGSEIELGALDLPELHTLEITSRYPVTTPLARGKWPKLETLKVDYCASAANTADLGALLAADTTPALKHVALKNLRQADDVLKVVAGSTIVKKGQVTLLDLSGSDVSEMGSQWLVDNAKSLANVQRIDLSDVDIPVSTVNDLRKVFGKRLKCDDGYAGDRPRRPEPDDDETYDEIEE